MCEKKKNKYMRREWEFCWESWSRSYLQISMMKRSIFQSKQKQKQQSDIDFANVCCFKFLGFELFEFLLIGTFWLIANFEAERWRIDDWQKIAKKTSWFDRAANSHWSLFFNSWCNMFSYRCCDVKNSSSLMLIEKM